MLRKFLRLLGILAPANPGAVAERIAAAWLQRERGFKIVARNWRSPRDERDELDLVCRDQQVLVFVEVKARRSDALVPGFHAVDQRKKRVIRRAARIYLRTMPNPPLVIRFDIVEVVLPAPGSGEEVSVLHFENVPLFGKTF